MNRDEARSYAKEHKIKGHWDMSADELRQAVTDHQNASQLAVYAQISPEQAAETMEAVRRAYELPKHIVAGSKTSTRRVAQKINRRERRNMVLAARTKILQAVNRFKALFANRIPKPLAFAPGGELVEAGYQSTLFSGRHINQAVKIARHHGLVDAQVLSDAGFNR